MQVDKTSTVILKIAENKQEILSHLAENGEVGTRVLSEILSLSQDHVRVILTEMIKKRYSPLAAGESQQEPECHRWGFGDEAPIKPGAGRSSCPE